MLGDHWLLQQLCGLRLTRGNSWTPLTVTLLMTLNRTNILLQPIFFTFTRRRLL